MFCFISNFTLPYVLIDQLIYTKHNFQQPPRLNCFMTLQTRNFRYMSGTLFILSFKFKHNTFYYETDSHKMVIKINVWLEDKKNKNVGHASMLLSDGTYISWWPKDGKTIQSIKECQVCLRYFIRWNDVVNVIITVVNIYFLL